MIHVSLGKLFSSYYEQNSCSLYLLPSLFPHSITSLLLIPVFMYGLAIALLLKFIVVHAILCVMDKDILV